MSVKIKKETLDFLSELAQNNNKPWFEANRNRWEQAKENQAQFMDALQNELKKLDDIVIKEPKKYVSRINRDIRFSKDKSPYKNNISSLIDRDSEDKKCKFYIHVSPVETFIMSGLHQPETEILKNVRQEIDYNGSDLHQIISDKTFKDFFDQIIGESLIRPPKGYDDNHPDIKLIKLKQYLVKRTFDEKIVLSENFATELADTFNAALPFLCFLDQTLV
ncbi:hypothetical protein A5893_13700 [Pedobacter psychrophilus]|uniref:TIGR02453 family protein n=1 Tax=Pedobacter psychrophilus TaxID=1826909 RepID=A0A179DBP7_9SPHI|nr:DUF2461 domain-containing protein [Pedobacter psychrophilus]OAQ38475.1 hypothetical protein A5893_13700 [Pedobacter psychrophilus]